MTPPSPVTRDGAQHAAKTELAKAIYHRNSDPLAVRAIKAVGHQLDRLINAAARHAPAGSFGALALVVVLAVVIVVVVWRVGIPRRALTIGAVLPADRTMSAAEHRALAERANADADWHTAVVERMRAVARELEERGLLDPRAGRTATEVADEAGRLLAAAAPQLRPAAAAFNATAYGGKKASPSDVALLVAADDAVRQSARSAVLAG